MSASVEQAMPIEFTEQAANQVKADSRRGKPTLKLRVFVTGGDFRFQYGFTLTKR